MAGFPTAQAGVIDVGLAGGVENMSMWGPWVKYQNCLAVPGGLERSQKKIRLN